MKLNWSTGVIALACAFVTCLSASAVAVPGTTISESTMPPQYKEEIKPELAQKYKFTYDGDFTKSSGLPTYEWMPVGMAPRAIVLGIHGLTLHGRRYRVLARSLAVSGVGFIAMDMRGFGRCKFDPDKQFSTATEDRTKVDHHRSYDDIVKMVTDIRAKYPGQNLFVMGESLGCTFCVKLANDHPDLVDGLILSAPAVKVNPHMYIGHGNVKQGVKAVIAPSHVVDLHAFMKNLVSERIEVANEMLDDPFILKSLGLGQLIATDVWVDHTAEWSKGINKHLPVLIIQGSKDRCVSASHVVDLCNAMGSDEQTIAWKGNFGHLQLETIFIRGPILDTLVDWLSDRSAEALSREQKAQDTITALGGQLVK